MGSLMGRAKKLKREGAFDGVNFTEIIVEDNDDQECSVAGKTSACGIELVWNDNVIRFGDHKLLINFLKEVDKKVA